VVIEYEYQYIIATSAIADSANPLRTVTTRQFTASPPGSELRQAFGNNARIGPKIKVSTGISHL
jgi:hypothetical protein